MKPLIWLTAPILAAAALPATAQIYRCVDSEAGITVFSDVPCAENAEIHESRQRLSVIARPDRLDAIAERNQEFLDQRSEALAQARQQRTEAAQRRTEPSLAPGIVRTIPVPVYPDRNRGGYGPERPSRPRPDDDSERRRQPVSALSGRQLGSRRDNDDG